MKSKRPLNPLSNKSPFFRQNPMWANPHNCFIQLTLLPLFFVIDGNIGQAIRYLLKLTQIAGLAEILPAFLKDLFLRVRQKARQFAVDTELLVTYKPSWH